jgi:hypothetical protein
MIRCTVVRLMISLTAAVLAVVIPSTAQAAPVSQVPAPSATFNGPVRAAVYFNDVVYVGGDFTSATVNGTRFKRLRLAALDRRNGALLDWTPTADAAVTALTADSTGIYVAGDFRNINGSKRDSLAKLHPLNGGLFSTFNHSISGHPNTLAAGNGRIYLGGTITSVDGVGRRMVAAFHSTSGALDSWAPIADGTVNTILAAGDRVYLGGKFDSVNGSAGTKKIAAVKADTGATDPGFVSRVTALVHDLAISGDSLYAGIDGQGGRASAMDLSGNVRWTITTDGDVQAIAVLEGSVYLGGHFDNVCRSANVGDKGVCLDGKDQRVKLAAVDAVSGVLQSWTANGNGSVGVHTLIAHPTHRQLLAGGEFTRINGADQKRFALFNVV